MTDPTSPSTAIVAMLTAEHERLTAQPGYDSQRTIWLTDLIARVRGITEAASQPREGDGVEALLRRSRATIAAIVPPDHRDGITRRLLADLAAALTQRPPEQAGAVPAGWKLVPMKPDVQMRDAGKRAADANWGDFEDEAVSIFTSMLSAAPTPPDAGSGSDGAGERV